MEYAAIRIKAPKDEKNFICSGTAGYPYLTRELGMGNAFCTVNMAKEYIQTMNQLNLWPDNISEKDVKVQKVTLHFEDV